MNIDVNSTLKTVEVNPKNKPLGAVIWLHGLGANGHDLAPLATELKLPETLPVKFIFPNAPARPVTINQGYVMPAWFDIYALSLNQPVDHVGIETSIKQIQTIITKEEAAGIPASKIILGGFSQGSVIALLTGLLNRKKLGGLMALSGFLPNINQVLENVPEEYKTLPIFIGHGTEDTVVPLFLGQMIEKALRDYDFNVSWHTYPIAHSISATEIMDIAKWMEPIFKN